jgi:hypothetical protein
MRLLKIYLAIIIIVIINSSCHKEKEDPCKGQSEVLAEFSIEEALDGPEPDNSTEGSSTTRYFESDTIIANHIVRFTARQDMDENYWKIGTDPKQWDTKSFTLRFSDPVEVDVMLVGKRKVKKECFPNDDGIDTVIKHLVVLPSPFNFPGPPPTNVNYPMIGSFEGHDTENPEINYTITFKIDTLYQSTGKFYTMIAQNFVNGCSFNWSGYIEMGYKNLSIEGRQGGCAMGAQCWAMLDKSNQNITIDYNMWMDNPGQLGRIKKKTFYGKRK